MHAKAQPLTTTVVSGAQVLYRDALRQMEAVRAYREPVPHFYRLPSQS